LGLIAIAGKVPLRGRVAFAVGTGKGMETTGGLTVVEEEVLTCTTDAAAPVTFAPPPTTTPVAFKLTKGEAKLAEPVALADTLMSGREGRLLPLIDTAPAAAVAAVGREPLTTTGLGEEEGARVGITTTGTAAAGREPLAGREALAWACVSFTTAEEDAFSAAPTAPTAAVAAGTGRPEVFRCAVVGKIAAGLVRLVGKEGRGMALLSSGSAASPAATAILVPF